MTADHGHLELGRVGCRGRLHGEHGPQRIGVIGQDVHEHRPRAAHDRLVGDGHRRAAVLPRRIDVHPQGALADRRTSEGCGVIEEEVPRLRTGHRHLARDEVRLDVQPLLCPHRAGELHDRFRVERVRTRDVVHERRDHNGTAHLAPPDIGLGDDRSGLDLGRSEHVDRQVMCHRL